MNGKRLSILVSSLTLILIFVGSSLLSACAKPSPTSTQKPSPAQTSAPPTKQPSPAQTSAPPAMQYTFKMTNYWPPTHILMTEYIYKFMSDVENKTNKQVVFKDYNSGVLAGVREQVKVLSEGGADFAVVGAGFDTRLGLTAFMEGPYPELAKDYKVVVQSAWAGMPFMEPQFNSLNLKPLSTYTSGGDDVWSKKQVKKLEDLKGMKVRGPGGGKTMLIDALGAVPIAMSTTEMYTALERGTIDGSYGITSSVISQKTYEVAKYCFVAGLSVSVYTMAMNLKSWNSLPKNLQDIIVKSSWDASEYLSGYLMENEKKEKEFLEGKGSVFFYPDDTELKRWQAAAKRPVEDYLKKEGDLGQKIYDATAKKSLELQGKK